MKTTSLTSLAAAAAMLGLLAGAAPAGAAATSAASDLTVRLSDEGTLLAHGAAASVVVTFTCPAGQTYNIFVELSQAVRDGRAASGNGFAGPASCSGREQTEDLLLLASGGFYSFREGEAAGRVSVSVCPNEQLCSQATDAGVVRLQERSSD
jgi:hypothetical protein